MSFNTTSFEIGKNRIEALSDGIFAIVMTLLILELRVPNLPPNAPNRRVCAGAGFLMAEIRKLHRNVYQLGIFLGGPSYYVPRDSAC
jgi:uncharacterized membrane protein